LVKDVELADLKKMIRSVYRGGAVLDATSLERRSGKG
jgi:hypothetical protein